MAIKINSKFIEEDIVDESGKVLGKLKFNPDDERIMSKLIKIVDSLSEALDQLKEFDQRKGFNLDFGEIESLEDFERVKDRFEIISKSITIESNAIDSVINDLEEIFGKETIEIFTGGTKDIYSLIPLIEFVMPHVQKNRNKRVNNYLTKNNSGVME